MGARVPPIERPRRGGIKCEFCNRAVPTIQALRTHQNSLHATALKEKKKQKTVKTNSVKVPKSGTRKIILKKVKSRPVAKVNVNTASLVKNKVKVVKQKAKIFTKKPKIQETVKLVTEKLKIQKEKPKSLKMETDTPVLKPTKLRKMEFQCPNCEKVFHMLFTAQKHIQKRHCVNSKDEKVASDSPDLIKPIQLELCVYCDEKFSSLHDCPKRPAFDLAASYDCMGCQQQFRSNKLFDVHVANMHGDQSDSLFFPTEDEFRTWKDQMEAQTQCQYMVMGRYSSKQVYRCAYADNTTDDVAHFCPSTIVSSQFPRGYQVLFYPVHYGHDYKEYELMEKYKLYSISDLIQQAGGGDITESSDENDLYLQFKTLMESIVLDAAKINIDSLKILIGKAVEMTSVLSQYDEDDDSVTMVNTSTLSLNTSKKDDQLTKTLEGLRSQKNKRASEENGTITKRLKNSSSDNKIHKLGRRNTYSLADEKDTDKILKELDIEANKGKLKRNKSPDNEIENFKNAEINSPTSFADSYKDFIVNTIKINTQKSMTTPVKKKNIVKTKIGQFKPNLSPKEDKRYSIGKAKEVEYEVRERENECNILVLKI